jgi:hypothetical protein
LGGRDVMDGQLDRIMELADLPTVSVHVLPFAAGAHAAMGSNFVLLQLPEPAGVRVVYLEDLASADYLDQPREVELYSLVFDRLISATLDATTSRELISKIRHGFL